MGVLLQLVQRFGGKGWPISPLMLGLGFIVPVATSSTLAAGALCAFFLRSRFPHITTLAAGAIAGESLLGLLFASTGGA
jgi:hypothetical protein